MLFCYELLCQQLFQLHKSRLFFIYFLPLLVSFATKLKAIKMSKPQVPPSNFTGAFPNTYHTAGTYLVTEISWKGIPLGLPSEMELDGVCRSGKITQKSQK